MDAVNNTVNTARTSLQNFMDGVRGNTIVYGLLAIFLAVYGPRLHPRLPPFIRNLFHNPIFRTIVILTVVYLSSKDLQLALLVTIGFLLVTNVVHALDASEHFENKLRESFEDVAAQVAAASTPSDSVDIKSQMGHLTQPLKTPELHPGVATVATATEQFKQFEEYLRNTVETYQGQTVNSAEDAKIKALSH